MNLFRKKNQTGSIINRTPPANKSVYSYYQNRSISDSSGRKKLVQDAPKRSKRRFIQHIPLLLLIFAGLAAITFLSIVNPQSKIVFLGDDSKQISEANKTAQLRSDTDYQQVADTFIKQSLINRSKLLLDTQGMSNEMRNKFPELAAVSVTVPVINRRPIITIQTTKPAFILTSNNKSVVVGNNGVALIDANNVQDITKLNLRRVNDQSGIAIELGKAALPQEQASFISIIVEQLEKQGIQIDSLTIPASPYDLSVKVKNKPYSIKFNILEDPKQQAGSYIALKKNLEAKGIQPKNYIDVRAGERVFYK